MTLVGRVGETLARRINRRQSVQRAATALFALAAAWSTQGPFGSSALANECESTTEFDCSCNFPWGFCTDYDRNYCDGAQCKGGCEYDYAFYPSTACWCSRTCRRGQGRRGYYKCCDCASCPKAYDEFANPLGRCGCRRFIRTK